MKKTGRIRLLAAGMVFILTVVFLTSHTVMAGGEFAGGTGVAEDPYEIANADQLNNVRNHMDAYFELIANIELTDYLSEVGDGWNGGAGWEPIGTWVSQIDPGNPFTGTFDGNGYTISNLYINRADKDGVGLFGYTNGAAIKDVRLENADITGESYVGSLVGHNKVGTIEGASTDSAEIQGFEMTGGLIGYNNGGTITNSNAIGIVTGTFCSIGGLVGDNTGEITNSYAQVAVQGDYMVGGLTGGNSFGRIESSYAIGTVSDIDVPDPESEGYLGGLVGRNDYGATITDSYATGNVDGTVYVGGLVGQNKDDATVTNSYANGNVNGTNYIGGLVGSNENGGIITNSCTTGDAIGINYVGGLAGYNFLKDPEYDDPLIIGCYAGGAAEGSQHIGGLVGSNNGGKIVQSYAVGTVTGTNSVGGLVGSNNDSVTASYYDSATTGQSDAGKGEPKTTVLMQAPTTFTEWDFADVWGINPEQNGGYPFFRWQTEYTDAQFAGGTGEGAAPYQVATAWQLNNARLYLDKHYILTEDINMSTYLSESGGGWNDGKGWEPISKFLFAGSPDNISFTGSFEGDGHTISNLIITRVDKGCIGLFGNTGEDVEIRNLSLAMVEVTGSYSVGGLVGENNGDIINCSIIEGSITGNCDVGGLVGFNSSGTISDSCAAGDVSGCVKDTSAPEGIGGLIGNNVGDIDNSYSVVTVNVDGYVNTDDNYEYLNVGGLVGCNGGDITNSYATGEVTALYATDDESSGQCIGGLVGFNSSYGSGATITNSYSTGKVTGEDKAGGLVGYNQGYVTNSYATGEVIGESNIGGLVGINGATITGSYYDEEATGQTDEGKGIPKTTLHMKLRSTFADWNFLNIWGIEDGEGYPALRWQDGAPQSGFNATAAGSAYMGKEFQITISQGKDADGDALNGEVSVRVYSETQDEDVAESGIDFVDGAAIMPVTINTSGNQNLRVYVDGISYSNLLTMELLAVESIEVTNPPDKTDYYVGEELDLTGLEVTGTYSDSSTAVLPITTANISGFDSSEITDNQIINVTYGGKSDTFTVNIIESQYESIAVFNPPDKTDYYIGENLDLEGIIVIGTLDDYSSEELTITMSNISGFDSSAAATSQIITVTYQGRTATFTVDILQVTYTVTYNANGGTGTAPTESDKAQGEIFTAASAVGITPPDGKQFKEWNTEDDGTGTAYVPGAPITMPEENLTFYAIWEDIPYIPSDNANLIGLVLNAGTLNPDFSQDVTAYFASVGNSVSTIGVTPYTADSNAAVTVNDIGVASGSTKSVNLNVGTNSITVVITAEDGTTIKTYTITVNRASSGTGGGGGGGRTPTPTPAPVYTPTVDSNGNITTVPKLDKNTGVATVAIDVATLDKAFDNSAEDTDGKKTVVISIPEVEDAKAYECTLPASALTSSDGNKQLEIKTGTATVTLPANMLTQETAAGAENISLTIAQADISGLDEGTRNQIGDRPVIQLSLKVDDEPYAWSNESVPVTVSIPYIPTKQELADPEHITVWYIDGEGNAVSVPNGRYDPDSGTVTFSTTHFSTYAVVYVTKTFNDLESTVWAKKSIEVLASKGILRGVSENEYAPQSDITRAEFLHYLIKTLGVDEKVEGNFDDISHDAYYYREIGIAKKLGITYGTGNNKFSPDMSITRLDMMVLTERALRVLRKLEVQGTASDLDRFTDKSLIPAYAINSIASLIKEELIVGSGDRINPPGNTTRAAAAVFLHKIYNIGKG